MKEQTRQAVNTLQAKHPQLIVDQAGGHDPFQASGTLHGQEFYFRFKHNLAVLRVGGDLHFKALYMAAMEYGEQEDQGWATPEDFVTMMDRLLGELCRAEIYWEFPGIEPRDIGVIKAGTPTFYGHWGHTAQQAWERLQQPSAFLRNHGFSDADQAQLWAEQQMQPETITVDDRVFPDPDPFVGAARRS